jgi:hypothetical protein
VGDGVVAKKALFVMIRDYKKDPDDPRAVCFSVVHPTAAVRKIDIYMSVREFGRMLCSEVLPQCEFDEEPTDGQDRWE